MICPNCNAEVSGSAKLCEYCGAALPADATQQEAAVHASEEPQTALQGQSIAFDATSTADATGAANVKVSKAPFVLAILALITSLFLLFPISIILAAIALALNSSQKKRGLTSSKQRATSVISIISIVISAIVLSVAIIAGELTITAYLSRARAVSDSYQSSHVSTIESSSSSALSEDTSDSSSSTSESLPVNSFVGTWTLANLVSHGKESNAESIKFMQETGMTIKITLNEDGTAVFTLFDADMNGTWESADEGSAHLVVAGAEYDMTLADEVLRVTNGTDEFSFTKEL